MMPIFVGKRPEVCGVNMLVDGSALPASKYWMQEWSDIITHLPYLFKIAKGNVLELGTRGGISTSALLAGVEKNGGHVFSVDLDEACGRTFEGHPNWTFVHGDSLALPDSPVYQLMASRYDVIFIDTDHTYDQLKAELLVWSPLVKPGGKIVMHDVLTFPGMGAAAREFSQDKQLPYEIFPGSNGLGVISF